MKKSLILFAVTAVVGSTGYLYYLKLKRDREDRKAKQMKLELEIRQIKEEEWRRRIMFLKLSAALLSIGYSVYYVRKIRLWNN